MRTLICPRTAALAVMVALTLTPWTSTMSQAPATPHWYRGNTHAHTLNSDGDSPPEVVARWYREHGYHFTFITDHEYITDVAPLNALLARSERFLLLSGQEITQLVTDVAPPGTGTQAHIQALGTSSVIFPVGVTAGSRRAPAGVSFAQTYARNIAEIKKHGGIAQINHPNYGWSVPLSQLANVPDSTLMEVENAHIAVNNGGGTDSLGNSLPSTEALWDSLLSHGKVIFGVASDDAHSFRHSDAENPDLTRPGRAWIWVRADTLTRDAILSSIRRGDFYMSTGVTLTEYRGTAAEVRVDIAQVGDRRYTTEFIGNNGRVLAVVSGLHPRYRVSGSEGYVRARITASDGRRAWTQPVMLPRY